MMKKFLCTANILFVFSLLIACSPVDTLKPFDQAQAARVLQQHYTSQPTQQMIVFTLPQKSRWKKLDLSTNHKGTPVMLVPRNEDAANWTESVRTFIIGYQNIPDVTPILLAREQIDSAKSHCRMVRGNILAETNQYAIYQVQMRDCVDRKNQIQFGKALKGRDAVYLVYYSTMRDAVSERMQRAIRSAELVRDFRVHR